MKNVCRVSELRSKYVSDGLTSKAIEMPSLPTPFNKPLGSFNEKASPITPATGANVIYLLLNDAMMPV